MASLSTTPAANACAQCGQAATSKCVACATTGEAPTWYCGRECQTAHWNTHRPFCTKAFRYPPSLPRYCEHCCAKTHTGCAVCRIPFCAGGPCYTVAYDKHQRACQSGFTIAELVREARSAPEQLDGVDVPHLSEEDALMFVPPNTSAAAGGCNNLFDLKSDLRAGLVAYRAVHALPSSKEAVDIMRNTVFASDLPWIVRLLKSSSDDDESGSAAAAAAAASQDRAELLVHAADAVSKLVYGLREHIASRPYRVLPDASSAQTFLVEADADGQTPVFSAPLALSCALSPEEKMTVLALVPMIMQKRGMNMRGPI